MSLPVAGNPVGQWVASGNAPRMMSAPSSALATLIFTQGDYRLNGAAYALANLPGWSYTGSVSGTGATVRTAENSSGAIVSFANGVPRITDLGLADEAAYTENWGVLNTDTPAIQWPNLASATTAVGVIPPRIAGAVTTKFTTTGSNGRIQHNITIATDAQTRVFTVDIQKQVAAYSVVIGVTGGTSVSANLRFDGLAGSITSGPGTVVSKNANWWRVAVPLANNSSVGNTTVTASVTLEGVSGQSAEVALPNIGVGAVEATYLPPGTAAVTRAADAATLTYSPNGSSATVLYGTSSSASVSPTSPINIGASSGGAWVGSYVRRLTVLP